MLNWFFQRRPRWRRIHDLFLEQIYSFEEIARKVGITTDSARRAVNLMFERGVISDFKHRWGIFHARKMIGFWRELRQGLLF